MGSEVHFPHSLGGTPLAAYLCSYSHGWHGPAIGPQSEMRCWPLLSCLWRAIAPLMKPWCAEAEGADRCDSERPSLRGIAGCLEW